MPAEVISLLSSSEAGSPPPPPPRRPRQITTQPHPLRQPPTHFFSDDISPAAISSRNKTPVAAATWNWDNLNSSLDVSAPGGLSCLLSDDEFDPSRDVSKPAHTSTDEPIPKRRRLGRADQDITNPTQGPARALEPVPTQTLGHRPLDAATSQLYHDPFASPSPQKKEQRRPEIDNQLPKQALRYLGHDPFASSSQEKQTKSTKARARPLIVDDIDPLASSSPGPICPPPRSPRAATSWDPISSSAPLPVAADHKPANPPRSFRKTQSEVIALDDSDDDFMGEPESDDDFPDISRLAASKHKFASPTRPFTAFGPSKAPKTTGSVGTKSSSTEPKKSSGEKAREKEEKAAAREAEKERKRLEKERAKEEKAHEKARAAALAEVNKIRTDKKVSTPEMIVDLPNTLDGIVEFQTQALLRNLDVQSTSWASPIENVVQWRRKVSSRYNDEMGHWEPVPQRVEREDYAMVVVPATQLIDLALGEEVASLESHVFQMRRHFPKDTIIYLIEGLAVLLRKNRNLRNRQFVSAVRSGLEPEETPQPPSSSQTRRRNPANTPQTTHIDQDAVEDALLQLQVLHGALIHHTTAPVETARWIAVFTQHISTVPYRRQRDAANDAGFCMETGQVRSGDGPRDTYVRMLQEIGRVTAPIAYGIASEFGSVPELVRGLGDGGPLVLEKVKKSIDKDGGVAERAVGQALSRRVHKIFLGKDEESMDI
ncbi:hypothetical protein BT67DRAFT_443334 [Trichocladium antarcticum]|uniref:ERCC4 domain-containing protein n=1 Tax=Trichocladium antarcticum TaxID=1450529 RepID=A0AAN6UH75_9PEZI|nr:hypothetical protein BT67DRAFT_443334 [Trichocladium antarcticum]